MILKQQKPTHQLHPEASVAVATGGLNNSLSSYGRDVMHDSPQRGPKTRSMQEKGAQASISKQSDSDSLFHRAAQSISSSNSQSRQTKGRVLLGRMPAYGMEERNGGEED